MRGRLSPDIRESVIAAGPRGLVSKLRIEYRCPPDFESERISVSCVKNGDDLDVETITRFNYGDGAWMTRDTEFFLSPVRAETRDSGDTRRG